MGLVSPHQAKSRDQHLVCALQHFPVSNLPPFSLSRATAILTIQTIIVTRWAELISKIGQFYLYIQYELTSVLWPSSARLFSAGRVKDDARG